MKLYAKSISTSGTFDWSFSMAIFHLVLVCIGYKAAAPVVAFRANILITFKAGLLIWSNLITAKA